MTSTKKRSGISSARAYRIQSQALNKLGDIYGRAVHFKLTHDEISDEVCKVLSWVESKKCPYHVRAFLLGYWQARRDEMYRHHITWLLGLDGELLTSKEVDARTEEEKRLGYASPDTNWDHCNYRSPWSRIDGDKSRHVWMDKPGGVPLRDKPFDLRFKEVKDDPKPYKPQTKPPCLTCGEEEDKHCRPAFWGKRLCPMPGGVGFNLASTYR
jgi:hypothetical protein